MLQGLLQQVRGRHHSTSDPVGDNSPGHMAQAFVSAARELGAQQPAVGAVAGPPAAQTPAASEARGLEAWMLELVERRQQLQELHEDASEPVQLPQPAPPWRPARQSSFGMARHGTRPCACCSAAALAFWQTTESPAREAEACVRSVVGGQAIFGSDVLLTCCRWQQRAAIPLRQQHAAFHPRVQ